MHPAMNQLSGLPVSERLTIVQELWDSIAQSQEQLPAQEWHREIVNARLADFDGRESEIGLTREQVWDQVDRLRGEIRLCVDNCHPARFVKSRKLARPTSRVMAE